MKFSIITLFPKMFDSILNESILKRARENDLIEIETHDLRHFAIDKHKTVDDTPYGGGTGMLLKVDVMAKAIASLKVKSQKSQPKAGPPLAEKVKIMEDSIIEDESNRLPDYQTTKLQNNACVILLTPQGEKFTSKMAKELAKEEHLVLICGHYEGFDERIREHLVDKQISIGDYVLTGGELPAMVLIDAISRFVPGVLPEGAPDEDSHSIEIGGTNMLEYPQYTKPADFNGWKVPDVLLSGNHAEIAKWQREHCRNVE